MAQRIHFTNRTVEALRIGRRAIFLDDELVGFGVRLTSAGKIYFVRYRIDGVLRQCRIGPHGLYTAAEARREARLLLRAVMRGLDPAAERRALRAAAKAGRANAAGASASDDGMERAA